MSSQPQRVRAAQQQLMAAINKAMSSISVQAPSKRKRSRKPRKSPANVPAAEGAVYQQPGPSVRRRRPATSGCNPGQGEVRVGRRELLKAVNATDPGQSVLYTIQILPENLPWLKGLAKAFERYKWRSVSISWRPAVGTTTNGMVAYGCAWDVPSESPPDRDAVVSLTPVNDHPVWQSSEKTPLRPPVSRLQSRPWYNLGGSDAFDRAPFSVQFALSSTSAAKSSLVGELWVTYDIVLMGTKKA